MKVELTDVEVHFIAQMMIVFYASVGKYTEHGILRYRQVAKKIGAEKELKDAHAWRKVKKESREKCQREWVRLMQRIELK